jgi:RimJ/RimL family protein N-acetyltransferase
MTAFTDILTERLRLRSLEPEDAGPMFAYRSDPRVTAYQGWKPNSPEEIEAFIRSLARRGPDVPGGWFQVGIALRGDGELIGDVGVHVPVHDRRQAEIGITLAPGRQGRGYGTEALHAVLRYLFEELGKHRVFGSVDPRNARSIALMERVGMRQEAHHVRSLWFKGEWVDDVVYAILDTEWRDRTR